MDLGNGLIERGYSVRLMGLYPVPVLDEDQVQGLDWAYLVDRKPQGIVAKIRMLLVLINWLRRDRTPLMVTTMPAVSVLLPLLARIFRPQTRFIIIHHVPVQVYHRLLDWLDGHIGRLASVRAILSVSKAAETSLAAKTRAYRAKSRVITNALPRALQDGLMALRPAERVVCAPVRLVATGRLTAQKNLPMLLNALAQIPDARLDLIGGGEDEAALRARATTLGIIDRVHFLGHRPRQEALRIMAQADIFVQISLYEGHSIALLEAAALGLPLVVSAVPSQIEGVTLSDGEAAGIIVPLNDDGGLASAIALLQQDPAAYHHWTQQSAILAQQHSFDRMIDHYALLFQSVALCDESR